MTEDSLSKSAEMQDRLTEAHEQHQELVKKLQSAEEAKRKMTYELQQVQMKVREREREGERGREGGREGERENGVGGGGTLLCCANHSA